MGLNSITDDLLTSVALTTGFIATALLIVGVICMLKALANYPKYQKNSIDYPFSHVLMLFILGSLLIILPILYRITENGVLPFTL